MLWCDKKSVELLNRHDIFASSLTAASNLASLSSCYKTCLNPQQVSIEIPQAFIMRHKFV